MKQVLPIAGSDSGGGVNLALQKIPQTWMSSAIRRIVLDAFASGIIHRFISIFGLPDAPIVLVGEELVQTEQKLSMGISDRSAMVQVEL